MKRGRFVERGNGEQGIEKIFSLLVLNHRATGRWQEANSKIISAHTKIISAILILNFVAAPRLLPPSRYAPTVGILNF